jgi:hypothetical protein
MARKAHQIFATSDLTQAAMQVTTLMIPANKEGSYVPQRWAAFLKNAKLVVEAELQDLHNRCSRLTSHLVAQSCLHILFGADNTSRNSFISGAEKAERGILQTLFPHVPSCQQSTCLPIPQVFF